MNEIEEFNGFDEPTENWSKLPHVFIGQLPKITSLTELKVVLYILRHTWGYKEYDSAKPITTDEFANGRKKKDGTLIDKGIGMSEPSIRAGIKSAIGHGFIKVSIDDSDLARIEKSYQLNIHGSEGVKDLPSGGKKFTSGGKEVNPRSEKETSDNKQKKDTSAKAPTYPKSINSYTPEHIRTYQQQYNADMTALVHAWDGDMYNSITEFTTKIGRMYIEVHQELLRLNKPCTEYLVIANYTKKKDAWKESHRVTDILLYVSEYKPTPKANKPIDPSMDLNTPQPITPILVQQKELS